jgi:hypothetical protein
VLLSGGESGETSFVSSWKDHDIMYHVAPLMPTRENDAQQVHRKRYIGNGKVKYTHISLLFSMVLT